MPEPEAEERVGLVTAFVLAAIITAVAMGVLYAVVYNGFAADKTDFDLRTRFLFAGAAAAFLAALISHFRDPTIKTWLSWWDLRLPERLLLIAAGTGAVLIFIAGVRPSTVEYYCEYGSRTDLQLATCVTHVSRDQALAQDSNASRFARGDLDTCLSDSGPFCQGRPVPFRWVNW